MSYADALAIQLAAVAEVQNGAASELLFVEHPPVLTLGASFHAENLRLTQDAYAARGIDVVSTDRGGDVTYHGPGQLVIYPIFNLDDVRRDLHFWLRELEETMLVTLRTLGIEGRRFAPHTGAWIGDEKVAAIGIKVKRWVSMHGISLNCDVDLAAFDTIIPCGIAGYGVTSLTRALGRPFTIEDAKPIVREAFAKVFGIEWRD